jgi:hypothetical protein
MARGGKRIGAGRKPKPKVGADLKAQIIQHPSSVPTTDIPSPIEEFDAPNDLSIDERAVWLKQAPHAFKNRTLTRATALSFERYCKVVVLERNEAKSSGVGGSNHRGLLKQINSYELQFLLTPAGKAMPVETVASTDDDEMFFAPSNVNRGA